jgi:hypothetical protein
MAEETELKTIQIGETLYDASTVTEQGSDIINSIHRIESIISQQRVDISISQSAKGKMMEKLEIEAVNFTAIPTAS